jgi:hypothetical protein
MEVHIGSLIKARAKELRVGPTELGAKIDTSKQNVYGIFKRKSVDTDLLHQISLALNFDFFRYYTDHLRGKANSMGEPSSEVYSANSGSMKAEIDHLRKENDYLKKINHLLDEKLNQQRG